jgi:hypothetical protein
MNMSKMRPFVFVETVWSDDSKTRSEPVEEWFGQWVLLTYGDESMWLNQIRPVRASLVGYHLFMVEDAVAN